jgi:hypothetical protein
MEARTSSVHSSIPTRVAKSMRRLLRKPSSYSNEASSPAGLGCMHQMFIEDPISGHAVGFGLPIAVWSEEVPLLSEATTTRKPVQAIDKPATSVERLASIHELSRLDIPRDIFL